MARIKKNNYTSGKVPRGYDAVSMVLHWAICLLVIALCITGFLFYELKFATESYNNYHYWHRSLGEITFVLTLLSMLWRRVRNTPPRFPDVAWRSTLAACVKTALVVLLVLVPLVKIWRGVYGIGWAFFSWTIAAPLPANNAMSHFLSDTHYYAALALIALSLLHSGAAIWHQLVRKDGLLSRMMPGKYNMARQTRFR